MAATGATGTRPIYRSRPIAEPRSDRAFHIINYCLLAMFTLSVLYPIVYVFSSSFSSAAAINSGAVKLWPVGFNVDAYKTILDSPQLVTGFVNSTIYAVAGGSVGTALTVLAGYPLVARRPTFPAHPDVLLPDPYPALGRNHPDLHRGASARAAGHPVGHHPARRDERVQHDHHAYVLQAQRAE